MLGGNDVTIVGASDEIVGWKVGDAVVGGQVGLQVALAGSDGFIVGIDVTG